MASEYGGGVRAIMDGVYLDELFYLVQIIKQRKIREYKIQLAIAENPHKGKDHKRLWDLFDEADGTRERKNKLDIAGFAALKIALSKNPKFIVK